MTISAWTIYLVGLCDEVSAFFLLGSFAGVIGCVAAMTAAAMGLDDRAPPERTAARIKVGWRFGAAAVVSAALCAIIPSSKTAAAMIVVPAVVSNERVQALAGKGFDTIDALLGLTEAWAKDLRPKAEAEDDEAAP